jgi:hypothetical protein
VLLVIQLQKYEPFDRTGRISVLRTLASSILNIQYFGFNKPSEKYEYILFFLLHPNYLRCPLIEVTCKLSCVQTREGTSTKWSLEEKRLSSFSSSRTSHSELWTVRSKNECATCQYRPCPVSEYVHNSAVTHILCYSPFRVVSSRSSYKIL